MATLPGRKILAERAMNTTHSAIENGDGKSRGKAMDALITDSEGEDSEDRFYHERSPKRLRRSATTSMKRRQS